MIPDYHDKTYRITLNGISLVENALERPDLVQVSVTSDCVILVAPREDYGITLEPNKEYRSWNMQGVNTQLARAEAHFIYARLNRTDRNALLLFSVNDYTTDGRIIKEQASGEGGEPVIEGDPSEYYYYIKIGSITKTDSLTKPTLDREAILDFGCLTTPGAEGDKDAWYELFEVTAENLIRPLKQFTSFVVKGTLSIIGKIVLNDKQVTDIARDIDEGDFTQSDEAVPTTKLLMGKYLEELRKILINKDREDQTDFLLKFGEFIDSMIAGKGTGIFPDGRIQTDRLEVRGSMIVKELIFNRWFAQEGNVTYSEAGTIEQIELLEDGTYDLYLRRRWDNDITAFAENDVCFGSVNNLLSTGEYYDSWFRVLNVMQAENKLNVVLYPDEEVPGGVNHAPEPLMVITRRGNPVNTERQGFWYISSYEGCICFLDGVTKPIIEENNYAVIIGKLKRLEIFTNLPINYLHSYVYCRGIATQDLFQIRYDGVVVRKENPRGFWSLDVAQSDKPYTQTNEYYDSVSHYGCEWMCLVSGTTDEPRYASTGWAMIRGNPEFTIDIENEKGWTIDETELVQDVVIRTLSITGKLYNGDVTEHILDADVTWTRDTGNIAEDNAWAIKRADAGKTLTVSLDDLGLEFTQRGICDFKATALLRDGQGIKTAEITKSF